MHPYGFGDVLQPLFAEILELAGNFASHLIQHSLRQDDGPGICQGFQASGDIDPIAVEVTVHDHDIAQIQADPQHQPPVFGQALIGGFRCLLQLHGALDGADRAPKLDEGAIAHQLDEAAAMLVDQRLEDFLARCLECGQCPRLIGAQEAAVADDIGNKNGCKPALHLLSPGLVEVLTSRFGRPGATDAKIARPGLVDGRSDLVAVGMETIPTPVGIRRQKLPLATSIPRYLTDLPQ